MSDEALRRLVVDDLKSKSDEDLAAFRANKDDRSLYAILADQELARRDRLKQHELDLKLITSQVRWMKFAIIFTSAATLIAAIVGAVAGATLTYWLRTAPPEVQSTPPQAQSTPLPPKAQKQKRQAIAPGAKEKTESTPPKLPRIRD
jgi:hypothetical protein